MSDRLTQMFMLQREFMDMLVEADKLPEYPVDLRSKNGQRLIRETATNIVDELFEAVATLKNKVHRVTDDRNFDEPHYREELIDTWSYFMELLLQSGMDDGDLFEEYKKKNAEVKRKFLAGY